MKKAIVLLLTLMVFAAPGRILVKSVSAMDFPEIKAKDLKKMMDNGEDLLLINPLSDIEYSAKHIPGSTNIPLQNILITEKLPKDKRKLIITYCLGRKWLVSVDAASLVAKRGYTNIMVFKDGIPGWTKAGYIINTASANKKSKVRIIGANELHKKMDQYLVVDVRPASAYKNGYLPDSRAMPLPYLSMMAIELPIDRKIVVVDHIGKRSKKAAQWLTSNGFDDVSMLKGGLASYEIAGFELEK